MNLHQNLQQFLEDIFYIPMVLSGELRGLKEVLIVNGLG